MPAHRLPLLLCLAGCTPADDLPFTPTAGGDDVYDVVYPTDDVGDTGDTGRWAHHPEDWLVDKWTTTVEICQPNAPFLYSYEDGDVYHYHNIDACYAQLLLDLNIDEQSFLDDGDRGAHRLNIVLGGMYRLLGRDLGSVSDLRRDPNPQWVRRPFIESIEYAAAHLGQDEVRQVAYNIVTSTIWSVRYQPVLQDDESVAATYSWDTHEMMASANFAGGAESSDMMLMHEAVHGWVDMGHVICPDDMWYVGGQLNCDDSWDGPYGHGAAVASLAYDRLVPEDGNFDFDRQDLDGARDWVKGRILNDWRDDIQIP